jgi:hypothetical protein
MWPYLHINIVAKDWDPKVEKTIEPWIYEATGTLSLGLLFNLSFFIPKEGRFSGPALERENSPSPMWPYPTVVLMLPSLSSPFSAARERHHLGRHPRARRDPSPVAVVPPRVAARSRRQARPRVQVWVSSCARVPSEMVPFSSRDSRRPPSFCEGRHTRRVYKYDLSMPVKDMYSLVEEARERFAEKGLDKDGSGQRLAEGPQRLDLSLVLREGAVRDGAVLEQGLELARRGGARALCREGTGQGREHQDYGRIRPHWRW